MTLPNTLPPQAEERRPHRPGNLRGIVLLLRDASDAWVDDNVPRLSASLAFYSVLSLVPFLIVITAIAARAFGEKAAQGQLIWGIQDLIGEQGAQAVQALIQSAHHSSSAATLLGAFTLAFGASAVVMELRDSLNTIWNVPVVAAFSSVGTFLRLIRDRFYIFGLILGVGILLVALLALSTIVASAGARLGSFAPVSRPILHLSVFVVSFVVVTLLFAAVYKLVPDVSLNWTDVMVGACFTSFLFTAGKQLIGLYLGRVSYGSTYGAAGSILIVLVWVYYSAQLFFFGAEFTKVYAKNARQQPAKTTAVSL